MQITWVDNSLQMFDLVMPQVFIDEVHLQFR